MSKDHLSAKERETRKVTLILHAALTTVLNGLEEKDYPHIFVSTNSGNLSSIIFDSMKFMTQFNLMFKDENRKLTVFDKALCLAMSLERNKVITTSDLKGRVPKRLTSLNEKLITEAVLGYIAHSSYHVKRTDITGDFSYESYSNGHKTDLKHMKTLLTEEFVTTNFDYNKCLALLYEIYLRGVCHTHGLPSGQIYDLKKKITVKEKSSSPINTVEVKNTYSYYIKSFRIMKLKKY